MADAMGVMQRSRLALVLIAVVSLAGCKDDPVMEMEPAEESSGDPPPSPIDFEPSNIELDPMYDVGDVSLTTDCTIKASGAGSMCSASADSFVFFEHTQSDGSTIGVFVVENLAIGLEITVEVEGDNPVAIVAQSTMEIAGILRVVPGECGGAASSAGDINGLGPGAGTGIEGPIVGGGGAAFCGAGGKHADGGGAGAPYGTPEIVPLVAGSSGGERNSGVGGGALQLVAGSKIYIEKTVSVPGGGGEDGGGGSGGALLIEAPIVTIGGRISVNGGGGASGDKSDGVDGRDRALPAAGGQGNGETPGGDGSAADVLDGAQGTSSVTTTTEFGSGGGGAGWMRINTTSGTAETPGALSPSLDTACVSEGTLG